jgi:hypothetical protein
MLAFARKYDKRGKDKEGGKWTQLRRGRVPTMKRVVEKYTDLKGFDADQ